MRYLSIFFFFVYMYFAYLQLNDPDSVLWVALYLVPAYVSFSAFKNKYSLELLIVLSLLYMAYATNSFLCISKYEGYFAEGEGWDMKTNNQELMREASGLCISVITYIIYGVYFYLNGKKRELIK